MCDNFHSYCITLMLQNYHIWIIRAKLKRSIHSSEVNLIHIFLKWVRKNQVVGIEPLYVGLRGSLSAWKSERVGLMRGLSDVQAMWLNYLLIWKGRLRKELRKKCLDSEGNKCLKLRRGGVSGSQRLWGWKEKDDNVMVTWPKGQCCLTVFWQNIQIAFDFGYTKHLQ